ncbi:MAG: signal peptidase I, partial [Bacilli bacterium]
RFYIIVKCNNIRKNKYSQIILGLLILVYVLFDFSMNIGNISNMRQIGMIESMGLYIIPSIIKNIMLTYLVYKNGYRSAILYQLIFSCYIYLVPVFPDLGNYFESILYVIFPLVVLLKLINIFGKKDNVFVHRDKLLFTTMWTVMISFMIMLIILVSGLFKFYILTIASGSMEPLIKIGDVIIIEKLKEDDLKKLKVGDVLVHKKDKETVVHRIIEIKERYKKTTYRTKGDANNAADNYIIYESDIIGRAKFRVPLVGYPTVWLNQIVKEKG